MPGATLFEKIWQSHVVRSFGDRWLIEIDRHFVHEGPADAFEACGSAAGRANLDLTFGVIDHDLSTLPGRTAETTRRRANASRDAGELSRIRRPAVRCRRSPARHRPVIAPSSASRCPACTLSAATATPRPMAASAPGRWGIGTTEVEQVLATQTLLLRKPKHDARQLRRARRPRRLRQGHDPVADRQHGIAAGDRLCGRIRRAGDPRAADRGAPDDLQHVDRVRRARRADRARRYDIRVSARPSRCAEGRAWDQALLHWRALPTDAEARSSTAKSRSTARGRRRSPGAPRRRMSSRSTSACPTRRRADAERARDDRAALAYMDLTPGQKIAGTPIDMPSSARAPTAACPICRPPPRSSAAARWPDR